MRIAPGTRALVAILGVIFLAVFAWMYIQANQTEVAYTYAQNMAPYTFIDNAQEDLIAITIPKNRDFEAVTNVQNIVGKYVGAQEVYAGTLVQAPNLIAELPSGQRIFPRDLLPIDTYAYPINIPTNISGVFQDDDLIDLLAFIDEDGEPSPDDKAVLVFQKVKTLGLVGGQFMVALTYEQIAAYEGWNRLPGVTFTAAINQPANPNLQTLREFEIYPTDQESLDEIFGVMTPVPNPLSTNNEG